MRPYPETLAHVTTDKGWALLYDDAPLEARERFLMAAVYFKEANADTKLAYKEELEKIDRYLSYAVDGFLARVRRAVLR